MLGSAEMIARVRLLAETHNHHDPLAFASLFAADGTYVTPRGVVLEGREAIAQGFRQAFLATPDIHAELVMPSPLVRTQPQ
jgi:uncharacterized protein (TIGR02246 family)